jgi:Tol biopolymer transport system component
MKASWPQIASRLRFLSAGALVVTLGGASPAPVAGEVLELSISPQVPGASDPSEVVAASVATRPPANLKSGVFRSVVETMWRLSPTFKQQCHRLEAERGLVVQLLVNTSRQRSSVRAWTEMSRKNGSLRFARVEILSPADAVELIAHEIEHVIEQLDGVVLDRASTNTTHAAGVAYESDRAAQVGRLVASEVRETRGRIVMSIPQRDHPGGSLDPASAHVSADGRFIAFTSAARLAAGDEDDDLDLYVLDLESGRTTLESAPAGWASRYRPILYPRISSGGRYIVFQAVAEDGPESFPWQVVVLDRRDGTARVVSVDARGHLANGHCTQAAISADGTAVVFESLATNLVESGDANGSIADILMVRLAEGGVTRVNVTSDGSQPVAGHSVTPAISADGRYVAFMSTADLACTGRPTCTASHERRKRVPEIYVRDTARNVSSLVSRGSNGQDANGPSSWPSISGDGRHVAFVSEATNLVRGDGNGQADIFLHDTSTGTTELVSRRPDGKAANGVSSLPAISADGRIVAFQSFASDLSCAKNCHAGEQDINLLWDVFVHDRSSGATVRASVEESGVWMEPSHAPSLDGSGRVLVFASRHSIGVEDSSRDDDLFVWVRGAAPTATTLSRRY